MQAAPRAPSPLRQSGVHHGATSTGIDPDANFYNSDDDDDNDDERDNNDEIEHDSSASVTQLAANFANRFGNFVGGMTSPSPSPSPGAAMMSSSEIEREAQRERERGRREAERILQAESQRTSLEDRVLAMLDTTRALPPPPSRSQTMPNPQSSQPPSPSSNVVSWWSAAKNRLTPTKDKDLTPAQQVILDVKRSEKEREKAEKEYQREMKKSNKGKEKEWPAAAETKYSDPAFFNLNVPQTPTPQHRRTGSPTSPSPNPTSSPGRILGSPSATGSPARSFTAPNLTPSPNRSTTSTGAGASPGRAEQPPLYAQFNPQGGLDVHLTLITIAKRFEKLEKWTVGHVRALEERMGDVERWLVDKEERDQRKDDKDNEADGTDVLSKKEDDVQNLRDEILELQGRIGELGREMAEMSRERAWEKVTPENLSSSKQSLSAKIKEASPPPTSSSFASVEAASPGAKDWPNLQSHKRVPSVRESTSPPLLRSLSRQTTGSRLPYPTGDYAPVPLDASAVMSGTFSPPVSPPGSLNSRTPTKKITSTMSGMSSNPNLAPSGIGLGLANAVSSGAPGMNSSASTYSTSYSNASFSSVSSISPSTSPSPSPRPRAQQSGNLNASPSTAPKGRVLPVPPSSNKDQHGMSTKGSNSSLGRAFFSSSPVSVGRGEDGDEEEDEDIVGDETIGKSSSRSGLAAALKDGKGQGNNQESETFTPTHSRIRAQSAYGFSSIVQQSQSSSQTPPLKPRVRSQSTSPHPSASIVSPPPSSKFVDPLVTRKQEAEAKHGKLAMPRPRSGKIPIGQLVKFFDGDARK
ncbi:hypothetical protein F5890DRAFT_1405450 [Lentinula detonsa]|uniref:Uncharacterized protein n=1 Tax=Lentinula detonsa TaxID=2804962 RepID=A0AA38UWR0_9AGAR|nr:hypothetical protein F5890DRAFT_1405450 [Lentinula detonsa]